VRVAARRRERLRVGQRAGRRKLCERHGCQSDSAQEMSAPQRTKDSGACEECACQGQARARLRYSFRRRGRR